MNNYFWHGIDLNGKTKKGRTFANSKNDLSKQLLKQNIALIDCKIKNEFSLVNFFCFYSKVTLSQKTFFFEQLSILLDSGIELLDALKIVLEQTTNKNLKKIIQQITKDLMEGESFSKSLQKHSKIFEPSIINIIKAGENADKLQFVIEKIAQYLKEKCELKQKLKQAALMPIITITFAFLIVWGIFVFVIPQFETLFNSMEKELPNSTKRVIQISNFLQSQNFLLYSIIFLSLLILAKLFFQYESIKKIKDKIKLKIYPLNKIYLLDDLISYLQVISLSLKSGVALDQALEFATQTIKNEYLKEKSTQIKNEIIKGQSLEYSFKSVGNKYFPQNLIAIVSVGEQSGNLDLMISKAANMFHKTLNQKLHTLITIFQPMLMIILGIIIVLLMLSIYIPIFNLASIF